MNDWKCRNCGFRFVPIYWIPKGLGNELTAQCPNCGSNATHEMNTTDDATYGVPKTTAGGKVRLDE